jgi:hypothetical protein
MFEMPSKNEKVLVVTLEFATNQLEKSNIKRLKVA